MDLFKPHIFDRVVKEYGGRLDRAAIGPSVAAIFDLQRDRALSFLSTVRAVVPALPPIHFDFVNATGVNAFATKRDGEYCIAINSGVVLVLSFLFGHALASPEFLPQIGDVGNEVKRPSLHPFSWDLQLLKEQLPVTPRDSVRRACFRHFVEDAFIFLVGHETAHIVNGHLDYLEKNSGKAFLAEFESSTLSQNEKLTRQTLEMDADCSAVGNAVYTILRKADNLATIPEPWKQFFRDPSQALFLWHIAICCLFRIFGHSRFTATSLGRAWYPPPRMRRFMAAGTAREQLLKRRPEVEEKFCADSGKAIVAVEQLFVDVFGLAVDVDGLRDPISTTGMDHIETLTNH